MTGDLAAAGDLITGALAGRAVEPRAGEGAGAGHAAEGALCLNCGTRLIGAHCHACGQGGHVHRTVGAIGHEIAHGVFHFEGKVWRTLPMLVLHPGTLTRRYIAGERVRFVSPLALFLFTVFLMFATISAFGGDMGDMVEHAQDPKQKAQFAQAISQARTQLATREARRADLARAGRPTDDIDVQITALNTTIDALQTTQTTDVGRHVKVRTFLTGWPRFDRGVEKARANPGLAIYKLQSSAYKYSWLLIPISTPFVALLFLWRRRFGLYDHAIFVTYGLSFMMLLVVVLTLLGVVGVTSGWIVAAVFFVPPIHMFAQLRGAYSLRKRSALWRTMLLLGFAFTAFTLFATLLLLHGLAE